MIFTTPPTSFWREFKSTPGAISVCEAMAISHIASLAPAGVGIDTGTHAGKAAMASANGLSSAGNRFQLWCIDPVFDLGNVDAWSETCQGSAANMPWAYVNHPDFVKNVQDRIYVASRGLGDINMVGEASLNAMKNIVAERGKISWAFLDSDQHEYKLVRAECDILEKNMVKGGIIAFHDFGNQFHAPKEVHDELIATGDYVDVLIPWAEIKTIVSHENLEVNNTSWHAASEKLPCFVGAVQKS